MGISGKRKSGFVAGACVAHWNMIQKHHKSPLQPRKYYPKVLNEQCTCCMYTCGLAKRFAKIQLLFSCLLPRYPLHQPYTNKSCNKNACSPTNPTALLKKLRVAPTTLPTIAGNASTAFPESLLSVFANLSNHFFKAPSSFGEQAEPLTPPSPPKLPMVESALL